MTKGIKTLLVDCDILVYRCGFASKEPEPLSYTLQSVKTVLENIYLNFPEATEFKLYLTGKGNYRESLATIKTYKGNRDPMHKPEYYDEIREYLVDYYGAILVEGQEADDAIAQEQWSHKDRSSCTVTIDKDILKGVPGWGYNWVKKELTYTTLIEANAFLFRQMLQGDSTDNIPGIKGIGPKTIDKLFKGKETDIEALRELVKSMYKKQYGDSWESAYYEIGNLLWIRREINKDCPLL